MRDVHRLRRDCHDDSHALNLPSCYERPDCVDAWRHRRMLVTILPLVRPQTTWMTIGDGRYGSDAFFLQEQGADVLATDINDPELAFAHHKGLIKKYRMENAEHISALDDSYDVVL